MNETKIRLESFAFYDYSGIQAHLEKMAAKGWLLERMGTYLWRYRGIEPRKLYFTVTYLSKISRFDPEDAEEQLQMEEYCTKDGWKLAARNGQMQIFYHEAENPVPIETDAVTQIETIRRAMRRNLLPTYGIQVLLSIFQLALLKWQFSENPIRFLSTPLQLYLPLAWFVVLFSALYSLGTYARWYRKAKVAAQNGIVLKSKSNMKASFFLTGLIIVIVALGVVQSHLGSGTFLFSCGGVVLIIGIGNAAAGQMQKQNVSREMNRGISIALCVCLTFGMIGGMVWYTLHNQPEPVAYYNMDGWDMEVFDAPLPLYVQDLMQTTQKDWSTNADRNETILVLNADYDQRPLTQDREVPGLSYTITKVKVPPLYPFCKSTLLTQHQDDVLDGEVIRRNSYEAVDAVPWNAKEAYQLYWGSGYLNQYLLCYEDSIVEIDFGWEPTAEQMAIVGQKIGR